MYTQKDMDKDLEKYINRSKEIDARIDQMMLMHEDLIVVERVDAKMLMTFLALDTRAQKDRIREGFYGRVISVSPTDTGDDIKDLKKKSLKRGDYISFNPESTYSLNVEGMYEVWVLSIENILVVDRGFDPVKMLTESLKKRVEFDL